MVIQDARPPSPRERIVYAAVQHLRRHGAEAMGLRALVADAGAPWGSLRHYFPDGKDQIVVEAVQWAGAFAARHVDGYLANARRPTPEGLLRAIVQWWVDDLLARDFERGCPLAATLSDRGDVDDAVRSAVDAGFEAWLAPIRDGLVSMGLRRREASELATLLLASLEGAILLARARRSVEPLQVVERRLRPLFRRS